jgi:branched-chain amino acid transport system permease protein
VSRLPLPADPTKRSALRLVGATLAVLVTTQLLFSGGTPIGVLFDGLTQGLVASLTTVGIVLVYRAIRVINFAQTALGVMGTQFFVLAMLTTPIPFPIALGIAVLLGLAVGVVVGVVSIRFLRSSRLVLTVMTSVASLFLLQFVGEVAKLSFFKDVELLPTGLRIGLDPITAFLPFNGWAFRIGDYNVAFGFAHVFALELAAITLLVVGGVLRFTKLGVAVRAMAENPERASLLGIGVPYLVVGTWGVAGVLSALSSVSTAMVATPGESVGLAPTVLLAALSAAVLARMEKLPTAIVATVLIVTFSRAFIYGFAEDRALVSIFYLVILAGGLLFQARGNERVEQAAVSWAATDEPRAIPAVLRALPVVRNLRLGLGALMLLALVLLPFLGSTGFVNLASTIAIGSIVVISLVVLTGWGGQVSLGQWGFAAVGAVVGGALTTTVGLPFWIAVPIAAAVSGAIATLVGIPALRIKGLFLLPVTLAFAFVVQNVLFDDKYFGWLLPDAAIERPTLFFLDFSDETSMYFLCVGSLLLAVAVVSALRRSRTGRILIALRENEANVQSFGVSVVRTKLLAFTVSGTLAGFAGAVFVHQQQGLTASSYGVLASLQAFNAAVIGGIASVLGALLGVLYFSSLEYVLTAGVFQTFLQNGGTIIIVLAYPGGFVSMLQAARDSVLRIVAQRHQLVVPSLFADYDADALERRLIPLQDPDGQSGLAALEVDERWAMSSSLYSGQTRSAAERFAEAARSEVEREKVPTGRNPLLEGASR